MNQSPSMLQILNETLTKTNKILNNLTLTSAVQSQRTFIDAVDLAYMQVSSGAMSYQQAIKNAIQKIAHNGAYVRFPSGHIDKLDVAVRRSVLTGVNQSGLMLQYQRALDMGSDLVETTAHAGARPDHIDWQGQIFSLSGKHKSYPDFVDSTRFGYGDGLGGWNCRHGFYPFFEGISERAYSDKQLRELNEASVFYNGHEIPMYEATQIQRSIERNIRDCKREQSALESAGLDPSGAKAKVKEWQAKQRSFIEQTGLQRDYFRERAGRQNNENINPLYRRAKNADAFGHNQILMQKKEVNRWIDKYGINMTGIRFTIKRDTGMINSNYYGWADDKNIGHIVLYPDAFKNEEQLIRTLLHEKAHVMQFKKYGVVTDLEISSKYEEIADRFEDFWYYFITRRL